MNASASRQGIMTALRGAALLLVFLCAWAQAQSLSIIQLRNRPADQVLPVIQPLLAAGGTASGSGFQLFVRTTPDNLAQIRQVVASLDKAARQLVIHVKRDAAGQGGRGVGGGAASVPGSLYNSTSSSRDALAQQVRTQEGVPAYVSTGTSEPLVTRGVARTRNGVAVQESVVPQDLNSGFYVTPRINGDTVFLDIGAQRQTLGNTGPGSADTSRVRTTVSGRLGQWIELGGAGTAGAQDSRGVVSSAASGDAAARSVYVRVEEVH
jgi:hypothetical protein